MVGVTGAAGFVGVRTFGPSPVVQKHAITATAPEKPDQLISYVSLIKGVDENQRPYELFASKGYQDKDQKNLVHLEKFQGQFKRASGADLVISSEAGKYDSKAKTLDLNGSVRIREDQRFIADMEKASFDVTTKSLSSGSAVHVTLENGTITADTMTSTNNGEKMLFNGNVKAHFN